MSIEAMRSEGAIGPALEAASNWALIDCTIAISVLAQAYRSARCTISDKTPAFKVGYLLLLQHEGQAQSDWQLLALFGHGAMSDLSP